MTIYIPLVITHALLVLIAALVGFAWGISEIVAAFKTETGYALRTGGAWLLVLSNTAASGLIYLFVATLVTDLDNWYSALLIGLAWPTIIRNLNINVALPLRAAGGQESAAIRFEQIYSAFCSLARQLIDAALTRQRMALVRRAIALELDTLKKRAHLLIATAPLQDDADEARRYIDDVLASPLDEDTRKALLAAFIMNPFLAQRAGRPVEGASPVQAAS